MQQPAQGFLADLDHLSLRFRPPEYFFFQTLHPQTKAVVIPVNYFDSVSPPVAEGEQIAGKQIHLKMLLHQQGQAVDRFAHVRYPKSHIDLHL